ncbi:acyl carrier protein [Sphingosinicella terrae]|jgi:acyl carrier protein|uniref:acyl carrier protein n=1 Tax=Sphingosinicella terrae TaxID=2172047 RepID=UPI000E0DE75B|nr:acyl carrier protein [Sphingosinicella terrae]
MMDVEQLRQLVARELAIPADAVTEWASFRDDLGADSLDLVELTMSIEEAYDVAVTEDEALGCARFGDALRLVREKCRARPRVAA